MAPSPYENLARDLLLLLIESGELHAVERDRLIAYETYHLPPFIDLELPDLDGYDKLLNPHTTDDHARLLANTLRQLIATEERNSWVETTGALEIHVHLSTTGAPRATPRYDALPDARAEAPVSELAEALVRVKIGDTATVLRRGHGLLPVLRKATRPRLSLLEAPEHLQELAYLIVGGPTTLRTADGQTRDYDAHARIPIVHDATFITHGRRLRPWERDAEGEVEVLGISRARRPALLLQRGDETLEWNRNQQPQLELGPLADEVRIKLHSGAGDHVEVETLSHRSTFVTWFDGAALLVPARRRLPLRGSHLTAIGHGPDAIPVRTAGAAPHVAPRVIEVQGWMPRPRPDDQPNQRLFGFELPVASVFEEGKLLDTAASDDPIRVPVHAASLVRPLFLLALDGAPGCKLKPLTVELTAEDFDLHIDAWSWIDGVIGLTLPTMRLRLEALGKVKLLYDELQWVTDVTADPTDAWQHLGWRLRLTPATLEVEGQGRAELTVDQRPITGPTQLPALREHRVQLGRTLYRVVRREVEG